MRRQSTYSLPVLRLAQEVCQYTTEPPRCRRFVPQRFPPSYPQPRAFSFGISWVARRISLKDHAEDYPQYSWSRSPPRYQVEMMASASFFAFPQADQEAPTRLWRWDGARKRRGKELESSQLGRKGRKRGPTKRQRLSDNGMSWTLGVKREQIVREGRTRFLLPQ